MPITITRTRLRDSLRAEVRQLSGVARTCPEGAVSALDQTWLLLQTTPPPPPVVRKDTLRSETPDFKRIRCPLCRWQPKASDRWLCGDCGEPEFFFGGCAASWNTFTTRGLCPGCRHRWRWTICLRCQGWSRHEAWYQEAARGE